jgi:hypothetical protein
MSDSRPLPEYGEYATPEQQAAAMGRVYVPPPDLATPASVVASPPDERAAPHTDRPRGNLLDRFVTLFELGIGIALLLSTDYSRLGENTNLTLKAMGSTQKASLAIDHYSWILLGANIVLLLASVVWAYATLRRGRLAFYIPIVGFFAFATVLGVVLTIAG